MPSSVKHLHFGPGDRMPLLSNGAEQKESLPPVKASHTHPRGSSGRENASVYFIGTATTIIEWGGIRILTDPNFLHAGDHVHLGPGVSATRRTNPAVNLEELPPLDCILLSHYHEDHFDRLVEDSLNRAFPIITTPHATGCLTSKEEPFSNVTSLDFFEKSVVHIKNDAGQPGLKRAIRVTGMPGKHVPPGPLAAANEFLQAVPPTNGWLLELGDASAADQDQVDVGYRIYISGDTLLVDELKQIPEYLQREKIDLMLVHLGGTTIPGPSLPLIMVTMDAKEGIKLMKMMDPDVTIPIHFDDYDVFLSPLSDFKEEVDKENYRGRVVYLDRGDAYRFTVQSGQA